MGSISNGTAWSAAHAGLAVCILACLAACGGGDTDDGSPDDGGNAGDVGDAGGDTTPDGDTDPGVDADAGPGPDADGGSDADVAPDADGGSDVEDATDGSSDAGPDPDDRSDDDLDPLTGRWLDRFGTTGFQGSFDAIVHATLLASDGTLYVGGKFQRASTVDAVNLALWNGVEWQPVGTGPGIVVQAIVEFDGQIIVAGRSDGGDFGIGSPNFVQAWNGSEWTPLGGALPAFGQIYTLEVVDGALLAGGSFAPEEGVDDPAAWTATAIARWNPDAGVWDEVIPENAIFEVRAIADTDAGFCIGGFFESINATPASNIACFDGETWDPLAGGLNSVVRAIEVYGDDLLVGGNFSVGDPLSDVTVGVVLWDGETWSGFNGGIGGGSIDEVRSLQVLEGGAVYVGGTFAGAGRGEDAVGSSHIVFWDGTEWQSMEGGVENRVGIALTPGTYAISVADDGTVYAGGDFTTAGGRAAGNFAVWDGTAWSTLDADGKIALGVTGAVYAMASDNAGRVFVGGSFVGGGESGLVDVAALRGGAWEALGDGLPGGVQALTVDAEGTLFAGGGFADIGITGASYVAFFNGTSWRALESQLTGPVADLAFCPDGTLIAGGSFEGDETEAELLRIARYDGETWAPLAGGVSSTGEDAVPFVRAVVCAPDGSIWVGGSFDRAGGETVSNLARWTEATGWEAVGEFNGTVSELVWYDGALYVGGGFTEIDGAELRGIARLQDGVWSGLGEGLGTQFEFSPADVSGIAVKSNGVFAAGYLQQSGTTPLNFVAWFDGTEWHDLDNGLNDIADVCLVDENSLYVGGLFTTAGLLPSLGIAQWSYEPGEGSGE